MQSGPSSSESFWILSCMNWTESAAVSGQKRSIYDKVQDFETIWVLKNTDNFVLVNEAINQLCLAIFHIHISYSYDMVTIVAVVNSKIWF